MTRYKVLQEFTTDAGTIHRKLTSFESEGSDLSDDELNGYIDAGWVKEDDAAVEGDEIPVTPGYHPPKSEPEGGGTPA